MACEFVYRWGLLHTAIAGYWLAYLPVFQGRQWVPVLAHLRCTRRRRRCRWRWSAAYTSTAGPGRCPRSTRSADSGTGPTPHRPSPRPLPVQLGRRDLERRRVARRRPLPPPAAPRSNRQTCRQTDSLVCHGRCCTSLTYAYANIVVIQYS